MTVIFYTSQDLRELADENENLKLLPLGNKKFSLLFILEK